MKSRAKTLRALLAAFVAGSLALHVVWSLRTPGVRMGTLPLTQDWDAALLRGAIYLLVPLATLMLLRSRSADPLNPFLCCGVPLVWVSGLFLAWVRKPWLYYGVFPWSLAQRDLFPTAAAALTAGYVFYRLSIGARPNKRLEPTGLSATVVRDRQCAGGSSARR